MQVILFTDIADTPGYGKYAGTYKVATEIRKAGYSCQVIDHFSFYTQTQLCQIANKFCTSETVLVGFSATLMEKRINGQVLNFGRPLKEFTEFTDFIKSKNPKIKICVGGARVTLTSHWPNVDFVILNKGDNAIIALLQHLTADRDLKIIARTPTKIIDGNDYFYSQDQFHHSMIRYETQDIIFPGESLPVEIARGCIFKCAFCRFDLIGKKSGDWQKSATVIRDELCANHDRWGTTHFMFTDELINESLEKMRMIHSVMTSLPFTASYTSYARLDLIWRYPEMRELLLESGAGSLAFGIETLNDVAGKRIGKGLGQEKIKETLQYCHELWRDRIIISSNFIVGLPGEDHNSIWRTVDYLVSDDCPLDVFGFLPLFVRETQDGRNRSHIDQDPKKFGYEIDSGNQWTNDHMDFAAAVKLVSEIRADPRVKNKAKFDAATWIGRIVNLGFSLTDIHDILKDRYTGLLDLDARAQDCRQQYYSKLMMI